MDRRLRRVRLSEVGVTMSTTTNGTSIQQLVMADLREREAFGIRTYGQPLYASSPDDKDGSPLRQAYSEALDLAIYLRWQLAREDHG